MPALNPAMLRILFVCTGNICRSPTAAGVFRHHAAAAGLVDWVRVDSAGTHDFHVGAPPDPRAQLAAARRGYDLSGMRGRVVIRRDFSEFDYVLAMDRQNLRHLKPLCPSEHASKLELLLEYASGTTDLEVPDPYNGTDDDFEYVLDLVENASRGLLQDVRRRLG